MKKIVMVGILLAFAMVVVGCGATRYDVRPEIKSELALAKQKKEVALTTKYYQSSIFKPFITREENKDLDVEQIDAGEKFFNFVKEELRNRGFVMNQGAKLKAEIGFTYKKGIILISLGNIATRWKVSYENNSLFEIVDNKLLGFYWPGGGSFTEEKGKELARLIVESFAEELGR